MEQFTPSGVSLGRLLDVCDPHSLDETYFPSPKTLVRQFEDIPGEWEGLHKL